MEKTRRGPDRKIFWVGGKYKSAVIMLRVSPEEKAAWTAAAEQFEASLSNWLRAAAQRFAYEQAEYKLADLMKEHKQRARAKPKTPKKGGR